MFGSGDGYSRMGDGRPVAASGVPGPVKGACGILPILLLLLLSCIVGFLFGGVALDVKDEPTDCPATKFFDIREVQKFPLPTRTALSSFPRSGNSWLRSLVEASGGFATSSVYCDAALQRTFTHECDAAEYRYLQKTHFPAKGAGTAARADNDTQAAWRGVDRYVLVVRNPWDTVWSYYQFRKSDGSHTAGGNDTVVLGWEQRREVRWFLRKLRLHQRYWRSVPLPAHTVRYEDLREHAEDELVALHRFLVPPQHRELRPSRDRVRCALARLAPAHMAYRSAAHAPMHAYARYSRAVKQMFVDELGEELCRSGYAELLDAHIARTPGAAGDPRVDCAALATALDFTMTTANGTVDVLEA